MQDLEELKKEVESGEFTFSRSIALDLIACCESAEKERDYYREEAELLANGFHRVDAELKELREQKPAIYFDGRKVLFNPEYKGSPSPNGEYYAAPVAQSRDSAEPDVRDIGNELHNIATRIHYAGDENLADELGAIAVRLWGIRKSTTISENASPKKLSDKDINEIIITYMDDYSSTTLEMCRSVEKAVLQSNANDHIDPFPFIPWSKEAEILNSEALANSQLMKPIFAEQSPAVAVPDGFQRVPVDPTSQMLDAGVAMALQVSVHGQGGWSKYIAALYAQLLANAPQQPTAVAVPTEQQILRVAEMVMPAAFLAEENYKICSFAYSLLSAPQASAEQKDKIFKIGQLAATLDCIDMDEAWARQDIFDIVTELTGKTVAEMFAAAKQSAQDEGKV